MDLRQLRTFVQIAELGKFSRASERLRVAQPALSRQIRLLEEELESRLFDRNSRGVQLTAAGEAFLEHAQSILRQVERARASVFEESGQVGGHVVFGMPQSAGVILAVPLIARFRSAYPQVTLQMIEGIGSMVHDWMVNGRLDVGVVYDPPETGQLIVEPLWSEDLYLIGPAGAFAEGACLPFAEAARLELALPAMGNGLRGLVEHYAQLAGVELNVVIEADAQRIQKELTARQIVHTILPHASVEAEIRAHLLSAARIVEPRIPRSLVLAFPSDRPSSRAAHLLGRMIAEISRDMVEDPARPDLQAPPDKQSRKRSHA